MNTYDVEYTDTFGGEANYSWVKRAKVSMPELTHYGYTGSADGTEYECDDLQSGCGGFGSVVDIFETFLSFLNAAAEARRYSERTGDAPDSDELFPSAVMQWAADNAFDIECAKCDLQDENGNVRTDLILEE